MTKRQTGIRLPDITQRQLEALCQSTGMNQSAVVVTAIDRMYREENMMATQHVYESCNDGQSIFDVLAELKARGEIPQNAKTGDRYGYGDEKSDPSIIGHITVRRNEMYAIKAQ